MVVLDAYSYFIKEYFDLVLLLISIGLCTNIRDKFFYIVFAILSLPLTFVAVTDLLFTGLFVTLIAFLLRYRYWKKKPKQKFGEILGCFLSLSVYLIIPLFSSIITLAIFKPEFNSITSNSRFLVLINSVLTLLLFSLAMYFIKTKVMTFSLSEEEKKIYVLQLGVFLGLTYLFAEIMRSQKILGIYRIVMVAFLIAQFAFTAYLTYVTIKKNREKKELENLKNQMTIMNSYTAEVEKNYQELRKFRHDYKNMLLGLQVSQESNELNKEYLSEMIDYSHQLIDQSVMRFAGISKIGIPSLKSLIITKLSQAEQKGFVVTVECLYPIDEVSLDEVKLIRIIGILLDNATEAAETSQDQKVNVLFLNTSENVEISIENSYSGKLPSVQAMSTQGFSGKGTGRGLGLSNIQEILKGNNEVEMIHYANNGLFVSSLIIKKRGEI